MKKLGATQINAAEQTASLPLTYLEKFLFMKCLVATKADNFEDALRRKDLFSAFQDESEWKWYTIAEKGIVQKDFEKTTCVFLAHPLLKAIPNLAKKFVTEIEGEASFAMIDLYQRANFMIVGDTDGEK